MPLTDCLTPTLAVFGLPTGAEWFIILAIGLLLFGRRLPEVGRSLGQGIVEFKKGLKGVQDEVENAGDAKSNRAAPTLPHTPATTATGTEQRATDRVS